MEATTTKIRAGFTLWERFAFLPEHGGPSWIIKSVGTLNDCETQRLRHSTAKDPSFLVLPNGEYPAGYNGVMPAGWRP